ncbi:MAG: hypothetical protein A2V85_03015 [Chloroflexi bacterium RBG_16_72_14]|nr:MAG: hypothetical protein A2V85_03015 [Chloroflexi bacterium RBG_16_72_14]
MADEREISVEDLAAIVSGGIEDADQARARGLASLLEVRLARLEGLRRELEVRRVVDDADPRLAELQDRLTVDEVTVRALDLEALRAVTPPAAPDEEAATIDGRILVTGDELPAGARARLRDAGGKLVRGVESRLDASGAFRLTVPAEERGKPPAFTVVVVDEHDREIARDERAVAPGAGSVEYREIPLKRAVAAAAAGSAPETPATPKPRTRRAAGGATPATGAATAADAGMPASPKPRRERTGGATTGGAGRTTPPTSGRRRTGGATTGTTITPPSDRTPSASTRRRTTRPG